MLSQENINKINGMTHKQLVRFSKQIGLKLGDYMKLSKEEIAARILAYCADFPTDIFESHMMQAFPQGLFLKGHRRHFSRPYNPPVVSIPEIPAPSVPVPAYVPPSDDMAQLAAIIARLTGKTQEPGITESRVIEIVREHMPEVPTFRTEVKFPNLPAITTKEQPRHYAFKEVLAAVAAGLNVLLVGPAGCGKTHLCEQVAEALGMAFGFTGAVPSEYKLLGFLNAQGIVVRTVYRNFYENGGLFLWDEMDGSSPNAMLSFNAGLANGHQDFPDCVVKRHENFRAIASANTYGNGADRQYVGRNQLDAASLDRFYVIPLDYDWSLEGAIYGFTATRHSKPAGEAFDMTVEQWARYVQSARKAVDSLKIRHVVSMRAVEMGVRLIGSGLTREEVERGALWKHLSAADIAKIKSAMV